MLIISGIILGFFASFLSALFGGGSGLIFIPGIYWLLTSLHMHNAYLMQTAVATTFFLSIPIGFVSSLRQFKYGNMDKQAILHYGITITIGGICGIITILMVNTDVVKAYFSIVMLLVAFWMYRRHLRALKHEKLTPDADHTLNAIIHRNQFYAYLSQGLALIVGFIAMSLGVAVFAVPFFVKLGLDMRKAISASTVIVFAGSVFGSIVFLIGGFALHTDLINVPFVLGAFFPTIIGSTLGVKVVNMLPQAKLRLLFITLIVVVAGIMALPH